MTLFIGESRAVSKYEREEMRITDEYIESIMRWITQRDVEILMLLLKEPYLTTGQIEMMIFGDLKPSNWRNKATKRLRRLYETHCIDRWFPRTDMGAGTSEAHYILDYAGARVIAKYKGHTGKFKWKKRNYISQNYKHYLKIVDFKSLLCLLNKQKNNEYEILHWNTQKKFTFHYQLDNKVNKGTIIPDAFCIYLSSTIKPFFLECDNATEPIETLKQKLLNYRRFYASGEWRQEEWARQLNIFPTVLFVFHDQQSVDEMVAYSRRFNSRPRFLFTTYQSLYADDLKIYVNSLGKKRKVVQRRNIRILDSIWYSKDGLVSL